MASRKGSDLLAFKAYFSNANLPKDLMVLLAFPGGYGGLVHVAGDIVSLSCCIRRDTLQNQRRMIPRAAQAVFHHICNSCGGAREVLKDTIVEGPWFAAGPLKTGIRSPYQNRILFVGNAAGEAHPIIAEGISMGIQSGWLVAKCLTAYEPAAAARQLDEIGKRYRKMWLKCFRQRIYLAALYAAIASRSATSAAVRPFIEWQPQLLTLGARLSGKIA